MNNFAKLISIRCVGALAALVLLGTASGSAQQSEGYGASAMTAPAANSAVAAHAQRSLRAVKTTTPPVLDGNLNETAWERATVSLGFIQKDPLEGQPSTEKTEFRVVYTPTTLYVAILCYDKENAGILASDRRRDSSLANDDMLSLVIDTFHDHRNAYLFRTNPLGTQYDALITDEGRSINENWDEKWDVAAKVIEGGWVAEFAIPFKSLRMKDGAGEQSWGLDVERVIRRKNEFSYWNSFSRSYKLESISQSGHLDGLEGIDSGMRYRIKPYSVAGFKRSSNDFRSNTDNASDVGMEVMKFRLTSGLTADLTWNTDFAQTEVDDQQVSLDRFPLFYPEKREFFLEGAGIFEFGRPRAEFVPELRLIHTRRIGSSINNDSSVPMQGGARITGNYRGLSLGFMSVQTEGDADYNTLASNYSVARIKKNVLNRSTIGGFVLSKEMGGTGDYNRVYGADVNFTFFRYLQILGTFAKTAAPIGPGRSEGKDWLGDFSMFWEEQLYTFGVETFYIQPNFRNDLGFTRRKDWRRHTASFTVAPRPKSGPIRRISMNPRFDYETDSQYRLTGRLAHMHNRIEFHSGDAITANPHRPFERIDKRFTLRSRLVDIDQYGQARRLPTVVVPDGDYKWFYLNSSFIFSPKRRVSGVISYKPSPGYYGGDLVEWGFSPRVKINNNSAVELNYRINDGRINTTEFTDHVVNFRVYYNFTNKWLTTTTMQYNNADSFSGLNFRLNYIYRPGDDFFLVYNEGRRLGEELDGQKDRTMQAKFTYSFDF